MANGAGGPNEPCEGVPNLLGYVPMKCNWCDSTTDVRRVLTVYLCEFCRVHWFKYGTRP